jgi:tetratricopeptide (TPR) repeat protein/predicted regulator of Ras-like GTPase activity (Roadblock/LC7/MglB family)
MAKDDSGFAEIEEYTRKLTQNPESLVFVSLAEAYRKSGMLDEAIETCLKGLQVHPSYMSAHMILGRAYLEKERFEEAGTEFAKVAGADINNIMAHSLLGQTYVKQGKYTNAIEEYQKVLTLNPDDTTAQQMLKQALEQAKHNGPTPAAAPTPAPAPAARLEEPAPPSAPAVSAGASAGLVPDTKKELSQAEAFTKQGDVDNAIKIYRLILEADPENLVVRQRLKDLELRKVQASTERKAPERGKTDNYGSHRDNDKITSDDILSVMKDTIPKPPDKDKDKVKSAVPPAAETKPEAPAAAPKPEVKKTAPVPVPTPVPPAPVPSAKPVEAAVVTAEITTALTKLVATDGIVGTLLIDEQGAFLDSTFKSKLDVQEMSKTAALIFEKTDRAVQAMQYGKQVKQILITGEHGQIFFNKFGHRILLVQADENINIGKMRLAMTDVNKVLR